MEDKRIKILRDMDTGKAITKLSIPAIIGFMVMAIYNVADTIFVSWWSYKGAGAVQVVFPIMMIASSIGLSFGIGGGSYISRLLGAGKKEKANTVVTTALYTGLIVAVIFIIISLLNLESLVKILGAEGEMMKLSINYGKYVILGSIFVIPSMVFNNSLRAEGSAKYSMIGMSLGSLINIGLDPIFIFGLNLGIEGAAISTLLSQGISALLLYQFYLRKKTVLTLHRKYFKPQIDLYKEILKVGLPTFLRQVLFSLSIGLLNNVARESGGDYLLSAMGIAIKVTTIQGFIIFGLGQGLQPVLGYNYGAKNMERVFSAQRHGFIKTFKATAVGVLVMLIFSREIMKLFTSEPEVIKYGIIAIQGLALALLLTSISNTVAVIYQAIGHAKAALLFSVLRQGIFLIPAILIMPKFFGYTGLLYSQFAADILTLIVSLLVYMPYIKKEKEKVRTA